MAGLKWNTGKLYYSTVELGYQHSIKVLVISILVDMNIMIKLTLTLGLSLGRTHVISCGVHVTGNPKGRKTGFLVVLSCRVLCLWAFCLCPILSLIVRLSCFAHLMNGR